MPSLMIHLKVGYEIGKKINKNSYDYYLGLIAPDTPNLNGFAEKNKRWSAHIREDDLYKWRQSLKVFYQKNEKNYEKDFIIGYYIHILIDIIFDEFLYFKIKKKILKDNYKNEEVHTVMSNDMYNYYFFEFPLIREILKSSDKSYRINELKEEDILKWKEKNINRSFNNRSKYINSLEIEELVNRVYGELKDEKKDSY